MSLDPISIATHGYWCDTGPWDISISTHGYICEVQNIADVNAPRLYFVPVDPACMPPVPIAAIARPQEAVCVTGMAEVIRVLPSLSGLIGPDADTILLTPDILEQIRSAGFSVEFAPEDMDFSGSDGTVDIDGSDDVDIH
jgi:hypothetical protein